MLIFSVSFQFLRMTPKSSELEMLAGTCGSWRRYVCVMVRLARTCLQQGGGSSTRDVSGAGRSLDAAFSESRAFGHPFAIRRVEPKPGQSLHCKMGGVCTACGRLDGLPPKPQTIDSGGAPLVCGRRNNNMLLICHLPHSASAHLLVRVANSKLPCVFWGLCDCLKNSNYNHSTMVVLTNTWFA